MLDENGKCDFKCPPLIVKGEKTYCCQFCSKVTEHGCSMGENRPDRCKVYDCKNYRYYVSIFWSGERWEYGSYMEIQQDKCDKEFVDKYNDLLKQQRDKNE
jgi:hypothetical protein